MENQVKMIVCPCCAGRGAIDAPRLAHYVRPKIQDYTAAVSRRFQINVWRMRGVQRSRELVRARDIVAFLSYSKGYTNAQIGAALGKRDHSTIVGCRGRAQRAISNDADFRADIRTIELDVRAMIRGHEKE